MKRVYSNNEVAAEPSLKNESAAAISPASEGNTKAVATQTDVLSEVLTTMKTMHSDRKDAGVMTKMLGRYVEALVEEGLESAKSSAALKCEGVGHPWSQDALQRDENKVHFYICVFHHIVH